jgi:hypothetical protein
MPPLKAPPSHTFWVDVLYCPKDREIDSVPPFTRGHSRFPIQQFLIGLHDGIWPVGMKVRVTWALRYGERHGDPNKKVKVEQKREYTLGRVVAQKVLAGKIEADSREFLRRAGKCECWLRVSSVG